MAKYNILITGAKGQVGSEINALAKNYPDHQFFFTDYEKLDIINSLKINEFFFKHKINACINCAAYTAVDKAESEYDMAFAVNVQGAENLAIACNEFNARFVHISTDFVFNGEATSPYLPDTPREPLGVYGQTKAEGEDAAFRYPNTVVVRTSWVYSSFGGNFVKTMMRLGASRDSLNVVSDQIGCPTYAADLADALVKIVIDEDFENKVGTYHYSNTGNISWFDFATKIMELAKLDCKVSPIPAVDYPTPAKRPAYSVLNTTSIQDKFGITIKEWEPSLAKCIDLINENEA